MNYVHIICIDGIVALPARYIGNDAWFGSYWHSNESIAYWLGIEDAFVVEGNWK